jgi:hypothetical protein
MTEMNSIRALRRSASVRTALILGVVAVVFFVGIIAAQRFGPSIIVLGAFGVAVIGLPLAAMVGRGRAR